MVSLVADSLSNSSAATTRSTSSEEISSYSPSCSLTSAVSNSEPMGREDKVCRTEIIGDTSWFHVPELGDPERLRQTAPA